MTVRIKLLHDINEFREIYREKVIPELVHRKKNKATFPSFAGETEAKKDNSFIKQYVENEKKKEKTDIKTKHKFQYLVDLYREKSYSNLPKLSISKNVFKPNILLTQNYDISKYIKYSKGTKVSNKKAMKYLNSISTLILDSEDKEEDFKKNSGQIFTHKSIFNQRISISSANFDFENESGSNNKNSVSVANTVNGVRDVNRFNVQNLKKSRFKTKNPYKISKSRDKKEIEKLKKTMEKIGDLDEFFGDAIPKLRVNLGRVEEGKKSGRESRERGRRALVNKAVINLQKPLKRDSKLSLDSKINKEHSMLIEEYNDTSGNVSSVKKTDKKDSISIVSLNTIMNKTRDKLNPPSPSKLSKTYHTKPDNTNTSDSNTKYKSTMNLDIYRINKQLLEKTLSTTVSRSRGNRMNSRSILIPDKTNMLLIENNNDNRGKEGKNLYNLRFNLFKMHSKPQRMSCANINTTLVDKNEKEKKSNGPKGKSMVRMYYEKLVKDTLAEGYRKELMEFYKDNRQKSENIKSIFSSKLTKKDVVNQVENIKVKLSNENELSKNLNLRVSNDKFNKEEEILFEKNKRINLELLELENCSIDAYCNLEAKREINE